jgi:glycosyltransferase involved in cell wall biosynthesis
VAADFTYLGDLNDTDKWAAYRRADLFVLPTYSENFGIVVAEALAASVPVLTTTGTPWKALVDHQCGWWIDPGLNGLVDALPEVLQTSDESLAGMGECGRRYAVETFAWDSIAGQMKLAYEWVLNGGDTPPCVNLG